MCTYNFNLIRLPSISGSCYVYVAYSGVRILLIFFGFATLRSPSLSCCKLPYHQQRLVWRASHLFGFLTYWDSSTQVLLLPGSETCSLVLPGTTDPQHKTCHLLRLYNWEVSEDPGSMLWRLMKVNKLLLPFYNFICTHIHDNAYLTNS
jgi:hypothetical protein